MQVFEVENLPLNTIPKQVERIHDAIKLSKQPVFVRQTAPSTQELLQQIGQIEQFGE